MDDPFYDLDLQDTILVDDLASLVGGVTTLQPLPEQGSAFAPYHQQQGSAAPTSPEPVLMSRPRLYNYSSGGANAHRRMFGYLSRMGNVASMAGNAVADGDAVVMTTQVPRGGGSSRFRHIMRERVRRENLSQGFADIHALLPPGTSKGGKNDIVGAAARYIVELEGRRQWLCARNEELILQHSARLTTTGSSRGMVVKVRAESERHSVAVDVFQMVLRWLKAMEAVRVTGIRSCFCGGCMWMNVMVECEVSACDDVDKAIKNALTAELEEFGMQVPGSSRNRPAFSCQVERGVPLR